MSTLDQLLSYDFGADQEFERGVQSILDKHGTTEQQREQILLKARLFYFTKKTGLTVTMEEYQNALKTETTQEQQEDRELSFAEIKALLESNQLDLIPNNKAIPERLNEAPASAATARPKRKPWETDVEPHDVLQQ